MSLGKRITQLRNKMNQSRKELALSLNISYSSISKYETEERFPDKEKLLKLSDYFNVSLDYLLGRSDTRLEKNNEIFSNAFYSISDDGLTKEDIDIVKAMIEQLKNENGLI